MRRVIVMSIGAAALVASCGGGSDTESDATSGSTSTSITVSTSTVAPTSSAAPTSTVAPTSTAAPTTTSTTITPTTTTSTTLAPTTTVTPTTTTTTTLVQLEPGVLYTEYVTISDESGLIDVSVPVEWNDVDGRGWESDLVDTDELIGPALTASPDRQAFLDGWGTPGVFIAASPLITMSLEEVIDLFWFGESCVYDGRYEYDDGLYAGLHDIYFECGPEASTFNQLVVAPPDDSFVASVQILSVTEADLVAADEILASFLVDDLAG